MLASNSVGKVKGMAIRQSKGGSMINIEHAMVTKANGIDGDFRRKPSRRQMTFISAAQWLAACEELKINLDWTLRWANILVDNIEFSPHWVGKRIVIGHMQAVITGETDPCYKMDQQYPGLQNALTPHWRGGICTQVIADGRVAIGDTLTICN